MAEGHATELAQLSGTDAVLAILVVALPIVASPVSYTHLTLPTIYSV